MTVPSFTAAVQAEVEKLPKVSGGGREADKVYVAQDVDKALKAAESSRPVHEGRVYLGGAHVPGAAGQRQHAA